MGNRHTSIRASLEGYPGHDTNPSLHDLAHDEEEPFKARKPDEDRVWSSTPGNEDRDGHVFPPSTDAFPYIHTDYAELRRLYNDPDTPDVERRKVGRAMDALGVPFGDAPTEVRDEDFDFPDHVPNCVVPLHAVDNEGKEGKVIGHFTMGHNVTRADPFSR